MEEHVTSAPAAAVGQAALQGTAAAAQPHGFSFIDLFFNADLVVQLIILGLLVSSVWSWAIMADKYSKFKTIKFKTLRFESTFWSGTSLDQLYEKQRGRANHPIAQIFVAAMDEISKSGTVSNNAKLGLRERMEKAMQLAKNRALDELENRLGFLATLGATAPFVGLFGTVWGIMHSFTSIAAAKNVSLATVAPGIAEALFATAIGLVAAIPAVIAYNRFSAELGKVEGKFDDFAVEFSTLISRQLDEGKL